MEAIGMFRGVVALGRLAWLGKAVHERAKDRATRGRIEAALRSSPVFSRLLTDKTVTKQIVEQALTMFTIFLDSKTTGRVLEEWNSMDWRDALRNMLAVGQTLGSKTLCTAFFNDEEQADVIWPAWAEFYHETWRKFCTSVDAASPAQAPLSGEPTGADSVLRNFGSPQDYPPSTDLVFSRNMRLEALLLGRGLQKEEVDHVKRVMILLDVPPERRWSLDSISGPLPESQRLQLQWSLERDMLRWLGDAEVRHAWFDNPVRERIVETILAIAGGTKPAKTIPGVAG